MEAPLAAEKMTHPSSIPQSYPIQLHRSLEGLEVSAFVSLRASLYVYICPYMVCAYTYVSLSLCKLKYIYIYMYILYAILETDSTGDISFFKFNLLYNLLFFKKVRSYVSVYVCLALYVIFMNLNSSIRSIESFADKFADAVQATDVSEHERVDQYIQVLQEGIRSHTNQLAR